MADATATFRAARDFLLDHATDYAGAVAGFTWPELPEFNWAHDWFDVVADEHPDRPALRIVEDDGSDVAYSYAQMADRSRRLAAWLRARGVRRGDHLLLMLGNQVELWESLLAAIRLGVVTIPASTLLGPADLADRIERGQVRHVVTTAEHAPKFAGLVDGITCMCVGAGATHLPAGWLDFSEAAGTDPDAFAVDGVTRGDDPMLLYFTSGTTSLPKLVEHTHTSYPVGHLSTMYWIGLRPGDVHLNISSPGWAKHAWSNVFAPWNAQATVLVVNYARFQAAPLLDQIVRCGVTTFCAPPTVWRMLIQADLGQWQVPVRELVGAGEPLNPEVIEQVRAAWGITIRDGYGQTETTAQVGNTPGQQVVVGSMGRPLPGYRVALVDPVSGGLGEEGEICLDLSARPLGLMTAYRDSVERTAEVMRDGYYHTGDVAQRSADGTITYVGRTDDVFKASDYRISPFELESVLIEHPAVVEAAVVPSPDPVRLAVPKAFVVLAAGVAPDAATAESILRHCRDHLAPYQRVRRLEFADLPKTISGKIRRVELREADAQAYAGADRRPAGEYRDDDFPGLRGS
jgi:acetyl-CoA synthetase